MMTDKDRIMKEYVWNEYIYAALMKGNISNSLFDKKKEHKAIQLIQNMVKTENNELIDSLLEINNWRAKTIAGCLIGFKNQKGYINKIGNLLVNQCGGVTGYCYAFARFGDGESIDYLTQYLNRYLIFDKYPEEKFQDWVFGSLRWIDKVNRTNHSNKYLDQDGLWTKFVSFEFKTKKSWRLNESKRWGNLDILDSNFEKMMIYYKENFEQE